MNRFRDDGPPQKKFRNDRSDFSSRGGRGDGRREDRFQSGVGRGGGSGGIRTYEKNPDIERHNAPPSRVLHVRGLKEYATQNDIVDAVKQFGRVTYVMMIPRNRQALVEMESVDAAKMVVRYAESSAIYVCGHPAFFNFSTSDSIKRPEGMPDFDSGMGNGPKQMESNILVIVVQNPKYPITVDVIHTITSPHGDVLRIMIMRKQNVTALVEFDNYESARKAKQALNGCDVYSGCCTLKIESAGPDLTRLNVMKNDKDTFDYTNPNPGAGMQGGRGALLGDGPPRGGGFGNSSSGWDDGGNQSQGSSFFGDQNQGFNQRGFSGGNDNSFNGPGGGFGGRNNDMGGNNMGGNNSFNDGGFGRGGGRGGMSGRGGFSGNRGGFQGGRGGGRGGGNMGGMQGGPMGMMGGPGNGPMPGSVLLVYGLAPSKFNCDKLFNIFCIYGNVVSIKMLRTKEGGAMVNMQDHASCERAVMNLNNSFFFDSKLSVGFSKQDFVKIHPNPSELADGSPSAKEYTTDKNNRFFSPDSINKTRFSPPTKVVHFFNAPPTFSEDDLKEVLKRNSTSDPVRIRIFPIKPGARSAAGLIEYASVADASEVMVQSNHSIIKNPTGKMPFSLKLSFSASPIIDKPGRGGDKRGDPEDK